MANVAVAAQVVSEGSGGRLVSVDGRTLPLRGVTLRADARGGVARVVLEQRFENVYDEPLQVTYLMPLPADGAVSGYAFTIGARRVVGEVDKKRRARERFEQALLSGQTAGIVEQERSSLFTQELGNVPPRTVIVAELTIDQRLTWLDEGAWEWRFPTAAGPRYVGQAGRVADASRTEIAVADGPLPVTLRLQLAIRDTLATNGRPHSPMHALQASALGQRWEVGFGAEGGVALDRDVVVRWPVTAPRVGLSVDVGRPPSAQRSYGLVSIVPPTAGCAAARARRRDLSLLLDTSGSMGGEPLRQSVRTCVALIETLSDDDTIEMIEFSSAARRWKSRPVNATQSHKKDACKWLERLQAGGGTEMVAGVLAALQPLSSEAQRQVVLLTDGYIGFETEVIKTVASSLPAASRLHVVGVGSAINRSLTGPVARAGRGVEEVMAPGEDPERGVERLRSRTSMPLVTDLELDGSALVGSAPSRLPDLYGGSPALAACELRPEGGTLIVRGRTASGMWEERVEVRACGAGEGSAAAAALYARERVEDLELRRASGDTGEALDGEIEDLGLRFQIATRLTTWIAISQEALVDPSAPTRREEIPQQLPHGVSVEGLGLRQAAMPSAPAAVMSAPYGAGGPPPAPPMAAPVVASTVRSELHRAQGGAINLSKDVSKESVDRLLGGDKLDEGEVEQPASASPIAYQDSDDEFVDSPKTVTKAKTETAAPRGRAKAAESSDKKLAAPRRAARLRRAVLRLHKGRKLVLELRVDGDAVDWNPGLAIRILCEDGSELGATFDLSTTRAGTYHAGQVIRLVLELDAEPGTRPVQLTVGDLEAEIVSA